MLQVPNGKKEPPFFLLEESKAFVGSDAVDPRVELGVFPEIVDVLVNLHERILGEVVGVIVVDHHLTDMPVHALLILAHEQVKPIAAGFRVADFRQELFVLQGQWGLNVRFGHRKAELV